MPQKLNRKNANITQNYPLKILHFGAGNFLRAFADWIIEELNNATDFNGHIVVVKASPHQGSSKVYEKLKEQDGLFHVVLTGEQDGIAISNTVLIRSIRQVINLYEQYDEYLALAKQPEIRFIISNTTEAGIHFDPQADQTRQPPAAFPAKLTQFLYARFKFFAAASDKGCIIFPCELIEQNGDQLKSCVLQYSKLWGLEDSFCGWLDQQNYFCNTLVDRIVPGYPHDRAFAIQEAIDFDDDLLVEGELYHHWVIEAPPSIQTEFPADQIGLNVKYVDDLRPYRELKVRLLPSLLAYATKMGSAPRHISLALAALIRFYKGEWQGSTIALKDEPEFLNWWQKVWQESLNTNKRVTMVLENSSLWGQILTEVPSLHSQVTDFLNLIDSDINFEELNQRM